MLLQRSVITLLALWVPIGALVLVLLCIRRAATALSGIAVTIVLGLPVVAVVVAIRCGGVAQSFGVLHRAVTAGDGATPGYAHHTRIDVVATLGRILPDLGTPAILAALVTTALLAASAVSAAHRRRGALDARTVTAAGLAIVVLTPNLHYAMLVLLPALVALVAQLADQARTRLAGRGWSALLLVVLLVPMTSHVRGGDLLGITPQTANLAYGLCLLAGLLLLVCWLASDALRVPGLSPVRRRLVA